MHAMPPHLDILFPHVTGSQALQWRDGFRIGIRRSRCVWKSCSPSYQIHRQVYHLLDSRVPNPERLPAFAQLYFIDTEEAV